MPITEEEISKEKKILNKTHNLIEKTITELSKDIIVNDEELLEFKKLSWKDMSGNDNADIASLSETIEGEDVVLSQMKSKYTLVIFWATWCENCKEEIPRINEAISLFKRADVDIVAISIDEDETEIKKYVKDNNISFKVASDLLGWEGRAVLDYAVYATPSMFIVDRDTVVIESQVIADIKNSVGILSKETLVAQHPYVTNVEEELKKIEKEEQQQQEQTMNDYFGNPQKTPQEKVEDEE